MLSIKDVSFCYKNSSENALTGINLEINTGEAFGLLGPNGAGKTTLLSLISGILPCHQGSISMDDDPDNCWRRNLSIVPQEYSFYPMLTTWENLDFFARVQGLKGSELKTRIDQAITTTGLEQTLSKLAGRCSGGLKRRLNLAIGLLNKPKLLLLDEPTVSVDPQSRAFILETIKQLANQGTAVIYTSHYMDEVEQLCDRVAIMDQGKVLLSGEMDTLLSPQQGEQQVKLTLGDQTPQQRKMFIQHFPDAIFQGKDVLLDTFSEEILAQIFSWCADQQIKIHRVHYGHQHLEDLFLSLTKRSLRD